MYDPVRAQVALPRSFFLTLANWFPLPQIIGLPLLLAAIVLAFCGFYVINPQSQLSPKHAWFWVFSSAAFVGLFYALVVGGEINEAYGIGRPAITSPFITRDGHIEPFSSHDAQRARHARQPQNDAEAKALADDVATKAYLAFLPVHEMSEDKSDKKLPVRYHKAETAPTPVDRVHAPVNDQTLLGRFVSSFVARLNKHTIERNTEEIEARIKHQNAETELAEAVLKRDRTVEHYLKHRDDIIADDHEQHLEQMTANRTARALARDEREHQIELARERRKQELNAARFESATKQWGFDAFNQSLPHRQERVDQMYRSGALDAQLRAVLLDKKIDEVTAKEKPTEPTSKQQSNTEQMLQFIDLQIEHAAATHASQEVIDNLTDIRATLSSRLEQEKNNRSE
jgi:hypothetical protein